jgi:cell division protease FtsH
MERHDYSEEAAAAIDKQVRAVLESSYGRAKEILQAQKDKLVRLAEALLEQETIDRETFEAMMAEVSPQVAVA